MTTGLPDSFLGTDVEDAAKAYKAEKPLAFAEWQTVGAFSLTGGQQL